MECEGRPPFENLETGEEAMSALSSWWGNTRRVFAHVSSGAGRLLLTVANRDESRGALGRHSFMLVSLILLLVALPFGQAVSGETTRFPLLLILVLISAVVVNSHQRWMFVVASLFGIAAAGGLAYGEFFDSHPVRIVGELLSLLLLGFTTLVMFNSLIQTSHVSQDTIVGGICVYLLIGLCFAMVFILMTDLEPGAIMQGDQALFRSTFDDSAHAMTLLYFSFVTLTTLGYGDVMPQSDMARMFAVSEALIGQLYLVVFMARLVALYVVGVRRRLT
jgi:voltage-gated potassium channel